jgi:transposase-like protein
LPYAARGCGTASAKGKNRFSSAILPPYARRSESLEVLIPILYLKGVPTGDFEEALVALLGRDAGALSASTIGRLKDAWSEEHARWSQRRPLGQTLRLLLGRRHPRAGASGG